MSNFRYYEELEAVELWAEDNGCISNEGRLSEMFDEMVAEIGLVLCGSNDGERLIDEPAMREWFNNWSDGLRDDDELHELQYSNYCYCGKFDF